MSRELLQLEPVNCGISLTSFWPSFDIEAVLSGEEQEVVCPNGSFVLVQEYVTSDGGKKVNFYCAHCQLNFINPPE